MLSYSNWLAGTHPTTAERTLREEERAADAWKRINEKPQSVVFRSAAGATVAAQTVRVEVDNRASDSISAAGAAPKMKAIVYGIKGHSTLANTDIKEGYRFVLNGDEYRCIDVIDTIGERQGIFEATG